MRHHAAMLSLLFSLLACGGVTVDGGNGTSTLPTSTVDDTGTSPTGVYGEGIYDIDRLLQVEVTLDPDDWEDLRYQARDFLDMLSGDECLAEPFESPFTWFPASVTIDGTRIDDIAVRKKGLLGSVEPGRPSLKLDFDRYVDGQRYEDVERLTLNNSRQDGSRIKTCLGYQLYADAGLPASRCSYAHVVVNGEDLGVYVNVEPVKKPMLRRAFGNDDGNLYEGTLSDFLDGWTTSFDDKTDVSDYADIEAATDALETVGDGFEAAVAEHFDLDEFYRAWALEALIGHWDSYTGNRNNFYVYADPDDGGRFSFMPWGIDAILEGDEPFGAGRPTTVTGTATLPSRLLGHPEPVEHYEAALRSLLDEVWDEEVLLARVDHAVAITEPYAWPENNDDGWRDDTIGEIEDFISGRRAQVESEWADDPPDAAVGDPGDICFDVIGTIDLAFETTQGSYGTKDTWSHGESTWDFELYDAPTPVEVLGNVVGEYDGAGYMIFSAAMSADYNVAVYVYTGRPELFEQPGTIPLDWSSATSYLLVDADGDLQDWEVGAYLGGTLTLTEASVAHDSPLIGTLQLEVFGG